MAATVAGGTIAPGMGGPVASHHGDPVSSASAASATASGTNTAFRPTGDAFVRADASRRNFGRLRTLRVDARPLTRSFLRFSVRGVAGAVDRAVLRLRGVAPTRGRVTVHALAATGWSERRITFMSSPRPGRRIATASVRPGRWTSVDVSSAVNGAGVVELALSSRSRTGVRIASREARASAPRLVVTTTRSGAPPLPPPSGAATVVAAGDIAYGGSGDDQTALLLDAIDPTLVVTMGDNAYDSGTTEEFAKWYDPTWGRHKAKTRPSPGNHEYKTPNASGYFDYFGAAAGARGKGWYSYDVGAWHLIALNTNGSDACATISCAAGSEQERWLRADLSATSKRCVVAYFHHPRFSTGPHGDDAGVAALWQALYDHGVELVLQGHDHNYQRWAPMTPAGVRDDARGIRSFVVGTGGKNLYSVGSRANLEARQGDTLGVLKLTLRDAGYDWAFVPVAGKTYSDSGSGSCR